MDVKLILAPRLTRIYGKNHVVAPKWPLQPILKEPAGVPSVLEIVWSVQSPERRILHPDTSSRGRQNEISAASRGDRKIT